MRRRRGAHTPETFPRATHLDELSAQLARGDIRRGQAVFYGPQAGCAACHAIGYLGGTFGPDLTRVAQIRTGRGLADLIAFLRATRW